MLLLSGQIWTFGAEDQPETLRYIIGFERPKTRGMRLYGIDPATAVENALGDRIIETFELIDGATVELTPEEAEQLAETPGVAYIEPDYPMTLLAQSLPWGIRRVYEDTSFPFGSWSETTGNGVRVAVMDTGIQGGHEDLPPLAGGYSTIAGSPWDVDENGPGSHVAGILAAQNNAKGVVGVAPGIRLYSVKVFNGEKGSTSDVIEGLQWAVANDMQIVSMSLGSAQYSQSLENACNAAYEAGVLLIAAAGNSGNAQGTDNSIHYPAKFATVIAVGSTNSSNARSSFSSTGTALELMAPGEAVYSTYPSTAFVGEASFLGAGWSGDIYANPLNGSNEGAINGPLVLCGTATSQEDIQAALASLGIGSGEAWIAAIDRDRVGTFADKVALVMQSGATAAVIMNDAVDGMYTAGNFSFGDVPKPPGGWVPSVSISYSDGQFIKAKAPLAAEVAVGRSAYINMNGTSMATPHVSGAAAMILATAPSLSNGQVRAILSETAMDLGLPKSKQGNGLIRIPQALAMARVVSEKRALDIDSFIPDEAEEKVTVKLVLWSNTENEVYLYSALYDALGRMLALKASTLPRSEYGQDVSMEFDWSGGLPAAAATVKAFMLVAGQSPLGRHAEMSLP